MLFCYLTEPYQKRIAVIENGTNRFYFVERRGIGILKTICGDFWQFSFAINDHWNRYSVLVKAELDFETLNPIFNQKDRLVLRTDSCCETGQLFGDLTCDCGEQLKIKDVKNDAELDKFIRDNYGSGCFVNNKKLWGKSEIYEIEIKGEDWDKETDLGTTTCPLNYVYKILYSPGKNKAMSVKLGQECGFTTDYSLGNYKCYDDIMIDSFRFE